MAAMLRRDFPRSVSEKDYKQDRAEKIAAAVTRVTDASSAMGQFATKGTRPRRGKLFASHLDTRFRSLLRYWKCQTGGEDVDRNIAGISHLRA